MKSSNFFIGLFNFIFMFGWWRSIFNNMPNKSYGTLGMRDVRESYGFGCKPKSTHCAIKQARQTTKDHSHLWNKNRVEVSQ